MDISSNLKLLLPLIPSEYRRPLILYIYYNEIKNVINSCYECLNTPITSSTGDSSSLLSTLLQMNGVSTPTDTSPLSDMDEINNLFKNFQK